MAGCKAFFVKAYWEQVERHGLSYMRFPRRSVSLLELVRTKGVELRLQVLGLVILTEQIFMTRTLYGEENHRAGRKTEQISRRQSRHEDPAEGVA